MYVKKSLMLWVAALALALPLLLTGTARAGYLGDGAVQNTSGGWDMPADLGVCVLGIAADGTLTLGTETSRPDCIAHQFAANASYTTQALCGSTANTDGGAHFWAETCVATDDGSFISLKDRDRGSTNKAASCTAAAIAAGHATGGTMQYKCTGSWQYKGTAGNFSQGFCYAAVDVTSLYSDQAACTAAGNAFSWKTTGSSANSCVFSFGRGGGLNGTTSRTTGNWDVIKNITGTTNIAAHATLPDLTTAAYDTIGECLLVGFSWNTYVAKTGETTNGGITMASGLSGSGTDQCARCHNTTSQYNSYPTRWVANTVVKTGHKNMLRKVTSGTPWKGPDDLVYTADDAGNAFNWGAGTITVSGTARDLTWIYGDWIAPAPRAVYKAPAGTDATKKVCTDPRLTTEATCTNAGETWVFPAGASYSCGRCHATGWSSDGTIQTSKEPETSFPNITWTRTGDAPANVVTLSGGIQGDANKYSSWDQWGIQCSRCHNSGSLGSSFDTERKKWNPDMGDVSLSTHNNTASTGPAVARLCMECHRQETGGLPYTWVGTDMSGAAFNKGYGEDPSTVLVGPYHNTITTPSHPGGNMFLNSPHSRFTGTWAQITTAANYNSKFIKTGTGNLGEKACMGCHNVHDSLVVSGHEPFENECATCHTGSTDTISPKVTRMNHPGGAGTPLEHQATEPSNPCEICHMPAGLHLWRINTSATYATFPSGATSGNVAANTSPDGTYTQAVWVDVDLACGQCHGGGASHNSTTGTMASGASTITVANTTGIAPGVRIRIAGAQTGGADWETFVKTVNTSTKVVTVVNGKAAVAVTNTAVEVNPVKNGAMYLGKATLAAYAKGMHGLPSAPTTAPTASFTAPVVSLGTRATITDTSTFDTNAPTKRVTVNWGDGATGIITAGTSTYHDYSTARIRSYPITLTASDGTANPVSKAYARVAVPQKLSAGGTTLANARVTLKIDGHVRKVVLSNASGAFSFGTNIPYGRHVVIHVYKYGVASPADYDNPSFTASDAAISIL